MSTLLAFVGGTSVGACIGVVVAGLLVAAKRADDRPQHIPTVANTRRDDGSRLLGEIGDAVYGVGSDARPEIHFGGTP